MRFVLLLVCFSVFFVGCGPTIIPIVTAPVEGKATFQGKPLKNYRVFFYCEKDAAHEPSTGLVQEDGTFTLTVRKPGDGAIVGTNRVWLTYDPPLPEEIPGMESGAAPPKATVDLPTKFNSADTAQITVEVRKEGLRGYVLNLN